MSGRLRRLQVWMTAISLATVVVVLSVGALVLLALFEREQVRQVDRRLSYADELVPVFASSSAPNYGIAPDSLVQVIDSRGSVVYGSELMATRPAMRAVRDAEDAERPTTASIDEVGRARVIAVPLGDNWVLVGTSLRGVEDAVATLRTALLAGVPALAALLGLLLWILIGRTLRPVRAALEREERLVADVSHELRSPLAGIRALLESESSIPGEIELNRLEALGVLGRLESIANGLLVAARHGREDEGRLQELVDLDEVALRIVDQVVPPEGVEVDISQVSGGQVHGSEEDLERMASNLLSNAVRHAASRVQVAVEEQDGVVTFVVSDDGAGIPPDQREVIFERFTRLDDARGRDSGGAGLGLPIVQTVVTAHGGTIITREATSGGAEFVVTLPASVTAAAAHP